VGQRFIRGALVGGPIIGGVIITVCTALLLALITALLFHFTPVSEIYLTIAALGIIVISTFVGGLVGARVAGSKGLINGLAIGLIFFILITGISVVCCPEHLAFSFIVKKLVACVIAGSCGGIIGVSS